MLWKNWVPKARALRTRVVGVLYAASTNGRRSRGSAVCSHVATGQGGSQGMTRSAGETWINYAHEYCDLLFMWVRWWEKTIKPTAPWNEVERQRSLYSFRAQKLHGTHRLARCGQHWLAWEGEVLSSAQVALPGHSKTQTTLRQTTLLLNVEHSWFNIHDHGYSL